MREHEASESHRQVRGLVGYNPGKRLIKENTNINCPPFHLLLFLTHLLTAHYLLLASCFRSIHVQCYLVEQGY